MTKHERRGNQLVKHAAQTRADGFGKRLAAYAAAAGATGIGLVAGAQPAKADIIFTPANQIFGTGQPLSLDLNNDGTIDFYFHTAPAFQSPGLFVSGQAQGDNFVGLPFYYFAFALPQGYKIGPAAPSGLNSPNLWNVLHEQNAGSASRLRRSTRRGLGYW